MLEAVERDITSLSNDYKFKKLMALVAKETKDKPVQIDDIYTKGWNCKGPWNLIVDGIRKEFEDTEILKEKVETMLVKSKEQAKQHLLLKREKDDLAAVKSAIESRLSDALMKADQV